MRERKEAREEDAGFGKKDEKIRRKVKGEK